MRCGIILWSWSVTISWCAIDNTCLHSFLWVCTFWSHNCVLLSVSPANQSKAQKCARVQKGAKVQKGTKAQSVSMACCVYEIWLDDDESVMQKGGDWSKVSTTVPESQNTCALEHRLSCSHITAFLNPSKNKPKNSISNKLGKNGKLTGDGQEHCMNEGLCLYCGEKGHIAHDCPKSAAAKAQAVNILASQSKAETVDSTK